MIEHSSIAQAVRGLRETFNYMNTRYGPNKNGYWWAIAHRARLIDTGQYIKTSEQPRLRIRWADPTPLTACAVREAWGEVIRLVQENS